MSQSYLTTDGQRWYVGQQVEVLMYSQQEASGRLNFELPSAIPCGEEWVRAEIIWPYHQGRYEVGTDYQFQGVAVKMDMDRLNVPWRLREGDQPLFLFMPDRVRPLPEEGLA